MSNFNPVVDGFHFKNSEIKWRIPIEISLFGHAAHEFPNLCGGMVYAALDYYHTVTPMPPDESPPPVGSPLQRYIVSRQGDAHESTVSKFGMIFIPGQTAFIGKVAESLNPDSIQNALKYGPTPICLARTAFDGGLPGGHHLLALACSGTSELTIDVYDPNFPDKTVQITGSYSSGFQNQESKSTWSHVFVDYGWRKQEPPRLLEGDWRWCNRCMGLFWGGHATKGACPAGGEHVPGGIKTYWLSRRGGPGESGWKWCPSCEGMFWGGNGPGTCPVAGTAGHDLGNAANYTIQENASDINHESGWRYCRACTGLYWGTYGAGVCPVNGFAGHDRSSEAPYFLQFK